MAHTFTFDKLMSSDMAEAKLHPFLHANYQMPSREWWKGANNAFKQLQISLEISHVEEDSSDEDSLTEPEGISPMAARAAALPVLKLFRIGTHLLETTPVNDPLLCVAFGTIDPVVYDDIFWEAVGAAGFDIVVYNVYNGLFELSVGGYEFKMLYRQCSDLLRIYPDVLSAPHSFLTDPQNGCLHISDMIETLKTDTRRISATDMDVIQLSYYYIRAWSLVRGFAGIGTLGRPCLLPKEILTILFDFVESKLKPGVSECIKHFLQVIDLKHQGSTLRGKDVPPENLSSDWVDLLIQLQQLQLREMMIYPHYLQVSVMFTCSGLNGGQWLSMLEERLSTVRKTSSNPQHYTIWPKRLVVDVKPQSATQVGPYEGYYIVGYTDSASTSDPNYATNVIQKWADRVAKDKATVAGECFVTIKSVKYADFETVFRACDRTWPRKPLPNPIEIDDKVRSRSTLELPIRTKVKKVQKDGKKGGRGTAEPISNSEEVHMKLRPASEVLNRIKYDPNLNIDEFSVGYLDRHTSEIQEKAASSWQRDTTHEEFIPEHRIQYFKKTLLRGPAEIVWDRRTRLDQIFKENWDANSGGPVVGS